MHRATSILGVLLMLATGCSAGGSPRSAGAQPPAVGACASTVVNAALPGWARTGFRGDGAGVPHVLSEHSGLVAVLFDYPPVASADPDVGNKILWVSRFSQQPMRPLRIEAALNGTKISVIREIPGGAGPSMVNLPKAGCWHLALNWSGHTDAMTLKFATAR